MRGFVAVRTRKLQGNDIWKVVYYKWLGKSKYGKFDKCWMPDKNMEYYARRRLLHAEGVRWVNTDIIECDVFCHDFYEQAEARTLELNYHIYMERQFEKEGETFRQRYKWMKQIEKKYAQREQREIDDRLGKILDMQRYIFPIKTIKELEHFEKLLKEDFTLPHCLDDFIEMNTTALDLPKSINRILSEIFSNEIKFQCLRLSRQKDEMLLRQIFVLDRLESFISEINPVFNATPHIRAWFFSCLEN